MTNKIAAADAYTTGLTEDGATYDQGDAASLIERITAAMSEEEARLVGSERRPDAVTATVDLASDPSFVGRTEEIEANVRDALDRVLSYLDPEPGNIEIRIEAADSQSLASGGSTYFTVDQRADGGIPSVLAHQLTTGVDRNGETGDGSADATITLSRSNVDRLDFGDGNWAHGGEACVRFGVADGPTFGFLELAEDVSDKVTSAVVRGVEVARPPALEKLEDHDLGASG